MDKTAPEVSGYYSVQTLMEEIRMNQKASRELTGLLYPVKLVNLNFLGSEKQVISYYSCSRDSSEESDKGQAGNIHWLFRGNYHMWSKVKDEKWLSSFNVRNTKYY